MTQEKRTHHRAGSQPPITLGVHASNLIPEVKSYIDKYSQTDEWYNFSLHEMSKHIDIPWTSLRVLMSNNNLGRNKVIEMIREANFDYFKWCQSQFNEAYSNHEIFHSGDRSAHIEFRNFVYMPYTSHQLTLHSSSRDVSRRKELARLIMEYREEYGLPNSRKKFFELFNTHIVESGLRLTPSQLTTVLQYLHESVIWELYPNRHNRYEQSIEILLNNPHVTTLQHLADELGISRQAASSIIYREREVMSLLEANERALRQNAQLVYVEEALKLIDSGIESVELIAEKAFIASKHLSQSTDGLALYELLKITKLPHISTHTDHHEVKRLRSLGLSFEDIAKELGIGAMITRFSFYYNDYSDQVKEMWKHDFLKAFEMFRTK